MQIPSLKKERMKTSTQNAGGEKGIPLCGTLYLQEKWYASHSFLLPCWRVNKLRVIGRSHSRPRPQTSCSAPWLLNQRAEECDSHMSDCRLEIWICESLVRGRPQRMRSSLNVRSTSEPSNNDSNMLSTCLSFFLLRPSSRVPFQRRPAGGDARSRRFGASPQSADANRWWRSAVVTGQKHLVAKSFSRSLGEAFARGRSRQTRSVGDFRLVGLSMVKS